MDIWTITKIADRLEEMDIAIDREAMSLARWIWKDILDLPSRDEVLLGLSELQRLEKTFERLLNGEPVQYIAGHAWFYGVQLEVNQDVLIPRPETEELVEWVLADCRKERREGLRIIDIGTGSGCIAIVLKKHLGDLAEIWAIDLSDKALLVAARNSNRAGTDVKFLEWDFLVHGLGGLGSFDIIVSNPPYVSRDIAGQDIVHRLKYEPDLALYPDGPDPDIFYKQISAVGRSALHPRGACYLELNEFRAHQIEGYFAGSPWNNVEVRIDMQGMPRMLKAVRNH
ncbi:MAG: peptide chain release factor N(5)-glutamine methyltransferase [Saprospiraceae bacterium]|nr:peptide chain release factor N(5)-glutamine methyltransferase [Candidatus Opimibacter iunctus]